MKSHGLYYAIWLAIVTRCVCFNVFTINKKLYKSNDQVDLLINKVQSDNSQLPYSYFELPFTCDAQNSTRLIPLSLGQIFRGDRITTSNYQLQFLVDSSCSQSCVVLADLPAIRKAQDLIRQNYSNEWIIDDLPGSTTLISSVNNEKYYMPGFPLGYMKDGEYYLNNHVMLVVRYHQETEGWYSIVGFEVYAKSVSDDHCPGASKDYHALKLDENLEQQLYYTYAVYWREEVEIGWSERWNLYINKEEQNSLMHYFSLVYSLAFVVIFAMIVASVLLKVLSKDLFDLSKDWRQLNLHIFEPPNYCLVLSILGGVGIQLLVTVLSVVVLFAFKILSKNVPGKNLSYAIFLYIFSATIAGYFSFHFYHHFTEFKQQSSPRKGQRLKPRKHPAMKNDWFHISFLSGAVLLGFIIITIIFLNFFIWAKESSTALPFGTIVVLIILYFFLEIPLALIGGYIAYKRSQNSPDNVVLPPPVTSPIASPQVETFKSSFKDSKPVDFTSKVPRQPFYLRLPYSVFIFGMVPFLCFYLELFYIYKVIWLEKSSFYYLYGFLFLTLVLLILLVIESVIIAIYLQLSYKNYHWQWPSFIIGGSISNYIFLYSIFYFVKHLKNQYDFVSILLYFVYSFLIYLLTAFSLGSVGLITGLYFTKKVSAGKKFD